MTKVYVAKTKNRGKGVFATNNIKKGEIILTWKGKVYNYPDDTNYSKVSDEHCVDIALGKVLAPVSPGRYLNHSCEPNAGVKGKFNVVAMRDINKDEEITIDYAMIDYDYVMKCKCSSRKCRKYLGAINLCHHR